jgi:hypothetical protein
MRAKRHHERINTMNGVPISTSGSGQRWPGRLLRFAALVLITLVIGHDLTFLAANGLDGLGPALARSGHGAYWPFSWLVALGGVVTLGGLAVHRLLGLQRAVGAAARGASVGYGRELLRLWPRVALAALVVFVAQEGAEHYLMHAGHVLQLADFVSGGYAGMLPAFVAASLLVAGIAALFGRTIAALEAAVSGGAALARRLVRSATLPRRDILVRLRPSLATPDIGRAPPV